MFARLKVYIYWPMAVVALSVVALLLTPAVAQAQGMAPTKDARGAERAVVVNRGDSLWSISEEQLGQNATPQQIAREVERIYALNRGRIGANPNLIFPGQEFMLPPVSEPSSSEPSTGATPGRESNEPAQARSMDRVAESETSRETSRTPVREVAGNDGPAPDSEARPETLPDEVAAAPVPTVRSLASKGSPYSLVESFAEVRTDGRRLVSLGILMLIGIATIVGASARGLIARRNARRRERWFRETYGRNYAAFDPFAWHEYAPRLASEARRLRAPSDSSKNGDTVSENHPEYLSPLAIARAKLERVRRKQSLGLGRLSRRHRALAILGPEIRSSLQQFPARSQRRPLRGRRRAAATMVVAAAKGPHAQHEEWEPNVALRRSLERMPLQPGTGQREAIARLKPHLEEAVRTLTRLERWRGLSDKERHQEAALRMLLSATKETE